MMNRQAELFEDGGLKDEGGMVDRQSGNKVPVGSTRKEVRDDIPAKLSEGEFVMPADVVRYHGLDKMMGLRDEAKMGLRKMDAMGQMGNSEEATMSDEMPFGMGDLLVVAEDGREVEMAEGGYVTMAEGGATRALGPTYKAPTNKPINFTSVMGEGKISYKEYRNAEGKNLLVSFIGGIPVYPIPEGYTEYTPGADEPVTPIQEVVQAGPPTPELGDEDRQRAGYEVGYSIGYENMTPIQLLRESKRMNSVFGKIAFAIPMLISPIVGAAAYGALGDKYPQLDAEINKRLKLDPKNKSLLEASKLSTNNKQGKLAGETVTTIKKFVGDKITTFFGADTLTKIIELSGAKTNTSKNIATVSKEVTIANNTVKKDLPSAVTKTSMGQEEFSELQRPPSMNPPGMGVDFSDLDAEDERRGNYPQQEFEQRQRSQREIDRNARLGIAEQEDFEGLSVPAPLGATPEEIREQILKDSGLRPSTAEGYGNLDAMNRRDSPTIDGTIPFGQFQGERFGGTLGGASLNDQYNFDDAVAKSREIADGPGFVETMRDKNRATVDRKTEERRAERDSNRGDYGFNKIYSGSEVYQPPRTSLLDQIKTGRTDTPDLTDAFAAALGYVYDGTVNGYVGKGAVIANDYLRSLPSAVYDLLGMSFKPAGAATMDSVAGQALSANDMKTVIENNAVGDDISSALRGGFDSSQRTRERGILPSGSQVAGLGPVTNEQLRQFNQGYMSGGIRYDMTMGGRGLQGTRPEGFGDQNLGFTAQTPSSTFEPNMRDRNMRPPAGVPKTYDAFGNETISMGQGSSREDTGIPFDSSTRYVQDVIDQAASLDASNNPRPYNDPGAYTSTGPRDAPLKFPSEMESILQSGVQTPVPALQAGASDFNQDSFNSLMGTQPTLTTRTDPDELDPRGRDQIPEFKINPDALDSRGRSQIPEFKINPDSGMGGAIQSRQSPVPISAPSVLPSTSFAPEFSTGMGGAIQDQQRRRESTLGQMTTPKFDPSSTVGQMTTPQYQPSVAAKATTAASIYDKSFGAGAQIITGIPLVEDQVYDVSDSTQRAAANKALNIATSPGTAGTGPRAHILSSGRKVPINSAIAQNDREIVASGYTGTDAEQNVTGKISGVNGLSGVVKSGVGNKAAKVAGKTVYKDSSGKAYTNSTFGSKVEVQLVNGKWSNKTSAKGKPVKYSKGTGVSSGHGTQNEQDNSSDKEESKIICTAMNASYGFGSYRQAVWLNYSNKHLTKEHEVGYHTLFLPLVYLAYTKDIKFIRTILEHGTRRRTADLRAELKGTKRNTLGRFYRSIFEPLCYTVGKIKIALGN